jgi:hypothetical protein
MKTLTQKLRFNLRYIGAAVVLASLASVPAQSAPRIDSGPASEAYAGQHLAADKCNAWGADICSPATRHRPAEGNCTVWGANVCL